MTHTLHRRGDPDSLADDFVVLGMVAAQAREADSAARLRAFARLLLRHAPASFGDMRAGNWFGQATEELVARIEDSSIVHAVFTDEDTATAAVVEIAQADLGISVVLSGLFDHTDRCCRRAGTVPHTVARSLGTFGHAERLPRGVVLDTVTMCGHGMVAPALVERMAALVEQRTVSPRAAAMHLARQCHCGIFNPVRAARLLEAMASRAEERAR